MKTTKTMHNFYTDSMEFKAKLSAFEQSTEQTKKRIKKLLTVELTEGEKTADFFAKNPEKLIQWKKTPTAYISALEKQEREQGTAKHKDKHKKPVYRVADSKEYKTFKPSITTQKVTEKYCHFIVNGVDVFYSFEGVSVYDKEIMDYVKKPLLTATYATYSRKEGFKGSYTLRKLTKEIAPENFSIYDVLKIAESAWRKTHYVETANYRLIFRIVDSLRKHGYKLNLPFEKQKKLEGNIRPLVYAINKYLQPLLKIDLEGIVSDVVTLFMFDYDIIKICAKLKGFYLLTQEVRHGYPLNRIPELSDVQAEFFTLWDNFYMSYRVQKKKNLANIFEIVRNEETGVKERREVNAQIVPIEEAEKKPALSFCDIQDNRLDSICWLIHIWGDDSRYYNADIGNDKEGVKLRRKLKKRMESALNTCGFPEGKASGGDYRKLCELAYCKYCA